jgi:hypothetical protein
MTPPRGKFPSLGGDAGRSFSGGEKVQEDVPPEVAIARMEARMEGLLKLIEMQFSNMNEKLDGVQAANAAAHAGLNSNMSALSARVDKGISELSGRIEPFEQRHSDQKLLSRVGGKIVTVLAGLIIAAALMVKGEWIAAWTQVRGLFGG